MEVVNKTPVPVELAVGQEDGATFRYGMLVAKATFAFDASGTTTLVDQDPHPLYPEDVETDLGILPADFVPRSDPVFEVIVHGAVYSGRRPVPQRMVTLSVGEVTREMMVFGPRRWIPLGRQSKMSEAVSFTRIPMSYHHAFGGSCEAHFDMDTVLDVEYPINKYGRGFDAHKMAADLAAGLRAPEGFPHLKYDRDLPNLEDPRDLIRRPEDTPDPYCWSAIPTDIGFHVLPVARHLQLHKWPLGRDRTMPLIYRRAHPEWVIPLPKAGEIVRMDGFTPEGPVTFALPKLRVVADYVLGERTGSRDLAPHMLMLLPEERRFYLVYRHHFTMEVEPDTERSFRIRLDEGWFQYPPSESKNDRR
jgi:hypothetical protein